MNKGKNYQIRLLNQIIDSQANEIKILKQALSESQSVSDNETKKKLCRVFAKCDMALKCEKNCSEFGYLMKCYEK